MDWKLILEMAKADERAARAKYLLVAKSANDPALKQMFENLAYEEEVHIGVLEQFEHQMAVAEVSEETAPASSKIRELSDKIADLKRRIPPHDIPPSLLQEIEDLEDELAAEKAKLGKS